MASTQMSTLAQLLRQPASKSQPTGATVSDCLDACVPVYSFPDRPFVKAQRSKLPRVESLPAVPDFYEQYERCDSPPLPFSSSVDLVGLSSFNELPLAVPQPAYPCLGGELSPSSSGEGSPGAVPVARLPRHALPRRHASDVELLARPSGPLGALARSPAGGVTEAGAGGEVPSRSELESTLVALWEDRADRGLFRYDVSQCATRVLPGRLGFVAQLNEGRANKKRPTEFRVDQVLQPFDGSKFNFTKAAMPEVLLAFQPDSTTATSSTSTSSSSNGPSGRLLPPTAPLSAVVDSGSPSAASPHLVLINVSPIDYAHVLLVPRVLDRLPQAVDPSSVLLALQFAREIGSAHFRVGYNSLGAFATINHLHFQAYHLPVPMPCERVPLEPLPGGLAYPLAADPDAAAAAVAAAAAAATAAATTTGSKRPREEDVAAAAAAAAAIAGGARVSRLVGYPVNAFAVEAVDSVNGSGAEGVDLEPVARAVGTAAERLQQAGCPFNLLVCEGGRKVYIFPQCYVERQAAGVVPEELLDCGINPAAFEIAGHLVIKRGEDFEGADEEWAERLLSQVSLDEGRFMDVARMCFGAERS